MNTKIYALISSEDGCMSCKIFKEKMDAVANMEADFHIIKDEQQFVSGFLDGDEGHLVAKDKDEARISCCVYLWKVVEVEIPE